MKSLFSLRFSLLLWVFLLLPLGIRSMSNGDLEPYPAILLPHGAGKVMIKEGIVGVGLVSLYGYDAYGKLHKIDRAKFLSPIPPQYFDEIVKKNFGISTVNNRIQKIRLKFFGERIVKKYASNPQDQKLAKLWLSNRLAEMGLSNSLLVIRYENKTLDVRGGKEIRRNIKNEQVIALR